MPPPARGVPPRDEAHRAAGLAAGRTASSLKLLERRLTGSHWPSANAAHAYMIGFLEGYFSAGGGRRAGLRSDEHWGWVDHYSDLVAQRYPAAEPASAPFAPPHDLLADVRDPPEFLREMADRARQQAAVERFRKERLAEIRSVAGAAGMSVEDVTEIYDAYDRELARQQLRPAVIDPRGVPFLHTPMARHTRVVGGWLSYVLPFAGVIEAFYGVDAATGEELSGSQRALRAGIDLVPVGLVVTGARIGVRAGLRVGGRLTAKAAMAVARIAIRVGLHPRRFLPLLGRLARIGRSASVPLRSAYHKVVQAARSGRRPTLTEAERRALRDLDETMRGGARGGPRAARRRARRLTDAQWRRLEELHPALPGYLDRRPKISLDDGSVGELAKLFRSTRRSAGTYQEVRSASGELAVIEKVHARQTTRTIEVLPPGQRAGDRTPDLRVTQTNGERFSVEITTPTLARRAQRGPAREGAARAAPPATKTRPPKSSEIRDAFMRKIKHGQISEANPGAIVVNVQRRPASGPMLTRQHVEALESAIADNPHIRELLVVAPTKSGRRVYRVGSRDAGLGLADDVLDAAAAAR